jgi:hypothetical protein
MLDRFLRRLRSRRMAALQQAGAEGVSRKSAFWSGRFYAQKRLFEAKVERCGRVFMHQLPRDREAVVWASVYSPHSHTAHPLSLPR